MTLIVVGMLLALSTSSQALLGYDCGGRHLNVTSISLLNSGDCDLPQFNVNTTETYIQLLQLSEYNYADVVQCKIEIIRTVFYCGMHSHISTVKGGLASYMHDIGGDACREMHQTGVLNLDFNRITGLKVNHTNHRHLVIAGTVSNDGKCKGVKYNDPYGDFDDVIVQAVAKITLKGSYVPIHLETGRIILKSGTICDLREGHCLDADDGHSFWRPVPVTSCDFHQYDILYTGLAKKLTDPNLGIQSPTIYSLVTQDITFALTAVKQMQHCGYTLHRTEHPKLLILETRKGNEAKMQESIPVDNLDIFGYVNSKFVYVERHLRTQLTTLYHDILKQRCELEKEVLQNTLSLATLTPDEFAFRLMKHPGYMAVNAGEAMHIVKCIPVEVVLRKTKECYLELPVTLRNTSLFISPKSRILAKYGTRRECSYNLPTLYRIEDTWIQLTPEPHVQPLAPQQLQPMTKMTWTYLTPGSLATSGIYSQADIDKLRDHIMFPAEKPAVLNSIARGMAGYNQGTEDLSAYNLLDEDALNRIAKTTASKLWGGFVTFGSATAGVLGIFIIIRIIKIIIDTAIHGYALHTVYGCSLHLFGAIWSSLTHLLIHLAHRPTKRNSQPAEATAAELEEVIQSQPTAAARGSTSINKEQATAPNPAPSYHYLELSQRLSDLDRIPSVSVGHPT